MSHQLIQIISAGGLLAVFLTMAAESAGIPISSEVVVPLGGALASQGRMSFVAVVAAATLGNLVGENVLGRGGGAGHAGNLVGTPGPLPAAPPIREDGDPGSRTPARSERGSPAAGGPLLSPPLGGGGFFLAAGA